MTSSRLTPPQALDLVSADRVRDMIAHADAELSALERDAETSTSAADRAEGAVKEAGLDPEATTWTMVRLQRFLDGLRDETQRDVETMLELARQQARFRLSEVGAPGPGSMTTPPPAAPVFSSPTAPVIVSTPPASSFDTGPSQANRAFVAVAETAVLTAPVAETAAPHLALVNDAPSGASPVSVPVAVAAAPVAPAPTAPVVVAPAPVAAVAVAPTPTPQPVAAPAVSPDKKEGRLHRLPISAILEVVAVLLILVFILLRLS
jgi:hypothetical protein